MRDDQDDLALEVQLDERPTRILIAVLGLALLCGVLTLIATQLGRPTATMEKVGTLADFPLGSVTRIQLNTTFTDSSPRIHAVTASEGSGTVVGVTPLCRLNTSLQSYFSSTISRVVCWHCMRAIRIVSAVGLRGRNRIGVLRIPVADRSIPRRGNISMGRRHAD